jgi:hypothetical protein
MAQRKSTEYIKDKKAMVGVEVGVWKGGNARRLVNLGFSKLYLIDPYIPFNNYQFHNKGKMDGALELMLERMKPYIESKRVEFIRETSVEGSKLFPDKYFDYIYIDGNHRYKTVKEDLETWYPKLKKGGVFSGHDYVSPAVAKACKEFAKDKGLELIFWAEPKDKGISAYKKKEIKITDVPDSDKDWVML